jgi:membrane AbrB-like protein
MGRFMPDRKTVVIVLLAAGCGAFFQWLGLPAAWFFGPLALTAVAAVRGFGSVLIPRPAYVTAQAVIGTALGSAFSPHSLGLIAAHAGIVTFVVVSVLLTSLLNGWVLVAWAGVDVPTAFLGTMPGGAGEMAALSDSLRADTRLVAVTQYVRLLIIIATLLVVPKLLEHLVPASGAVASATAAAPRAAAIVSGWGDTALLLVFVGAGYLAGIHRAIPAGTMVVPALLYLALSYFGHTPGRFPYPVFAVAYLFMGLQIGGRFEPSTLVEIKRLAVPLLTTTALLMACCAGLAVWLARELHLDTVSAYLAATPGGLDSVLLLGPWLVRGAAHRLRKSGAEKSRGKSEAPPSTSFRPGQ